MCNFFFIVRLYLSPLSSHYSPLLSHPTSHIQFSPAPLSLFMGTLYMFHDDPSHSLHCYPSPPSPLVTVSFFFISVSLVLCCLFFVWLIRFHIQVRSYGVSFSPPGLFHLAQCFPVPLTLTLRAGAPSFFLLHSIPLCKCTTFF